ncbi:flippase-like domain-containing protein [Fulvivirga sp. M361]|uniref:lysylphosphatidylglycerol synthase transmembrane domain-containing protein n=1 Tax=Fulvivirga sp. M361 TaxID=2594266 RepID=UPI00117B902E|nr:lysylphosphatidylglycerol synthase transmembrane domain-containing protein [Fulvivirga sp. M361]TRX48907.1 flippase-like domain-containing protein [Fulvivirga sp. M361]
MNLNSQKILKTLNPNKVWLPAVISLGFVVYIVLSDEDFTPQKFNLIFQANYLPLTMAFAILLLKEAAYIYRIRILTNNDLSWSSSVYVIMLWEFASAVTPSVVGGTAVAIFILLKEKINLGKSMSYVTLTAILDNLFFVVAAPLVILLIGIDIFPDSGRAVRGIFVSSYSLIALYTLVMAMALLWKPRLFKWVIIKISSVGFLRRWRYSAYQHGNEIMWAASLIKGKKKRYWFQIILATIIAWVCRYAILNFIIAAYNGELSFADHLLILGKNLILWIVMLLSPTPGSSGTAEHFFIQFFTEYLNDFTLGTTLLWRIITYYPYLIVGALILPHWIKRVFYKGKEKLK